MSEATGSVPLAASGKVDIELWRAVARTVLCRSRTPGYDDLLAENAEFESWIHRLVEVVERRLREQPSPAQEVAARAALEGLPVVLERVPAGVHSAVSLSRVMARRVLRLCDVTEEAKGCTHPEVKDKHCTKCRKRIYL